jgi:lipid A ethanolaminephosphotransferase
MHPLHDMSQTRSDQARATARLRPARPEISPLALILGVSLFIMAAHNFTFWQRAWAVFDGNIRHVAGWGIAVWMLTTLMVAFFGFRWFIKPVAAFGLVLSAVTSYFMDKLGIIIDRKMMQNAMLTTVTEAKHLLTLGFLLHVAIWGLLPAAAVMFVRLRQRPLATNIWRWALTVVTAVAIFFGALFSDFKAYSAVAREHKEVLASYQPGAAIGGAARYAKMMLRNKNLTIAPLGADARKGSLIAAAEKPVLTVIFVGETARAQNFGLNGYGRPTTPELSRRDIVNFSNVSSCGTSTAVSVPCMLSNLTRGGYSYDAAFQQENLTDVLAHAGIDVLWWDNNTGDQGTSGRVAHPRRMTPADDPAACAQGECTDAVFLTPLKKALPKLERDTVLFIHMIGSHGPAYFLRYPPEAEIFTPACRTAEFADCTTDEIVNAYDNSIRFTDHVIARMIDLLAAQSTVIPAVLFLSDHGESLGEDGLYLHAAPYFLAPDTQTQVPMVLWLSAEYRRQLKVDQACLRAKGDAPLSQDNLFHTVLGLMDVVSSVREDRLDLASACRG